MDLALPNMHGAITTLIFLGVTSAVLFKYVPTPNSYQSKTNPTTYFLRFFFAISFAFFFYTLKNIVSEWFAILVVHNLYLIGMYCLVFGLKARQQQDKQGISLHWVWLNMLIISVINIGVFFLYAPNALMRALILNANLIALMVYGITCIPKQDIRFKRGERVFKYVLWICIAITFVSPIMLALSGSIKTYFSYSIMLQSVQLHIVFGGLCVLILSDLIDQHYKNSVTDAMTGMYNRRYFMQKSDALLMSQHQKKRESLGALILCDIDNFKRINDSHGHDTGDKVIIQFGQLLRKMVRENDILARVGGEEFAIFLPNTSVETAEKIAERIRSYTEQITLTSRTEGEIRYTASFGVASLKDSLKIGVLMRAADNALYCAKHAGRNQVRVYMGNSFQAETLPMSNPLY